MSTGTKDHRLDMKGPPRKAIVVDDEAVIRYSMKKFLEEDGFIVLTASKGMEALKKIEEEKPELVILDVKLPDSNGLSLLSTIKDLNPETVVIIITGHADIKSAVEAMKMGALDYLEKPIDFDSLRNTLFRIKSQEAEIASITSGEQFITLNPAMKEIYRIAENLAIKSDVTILILGESGTGKNFLAQKLHEVSPRKTMPFVEVSCSNIPEHLIESELFGYEKGAFTDAKVSKRGLVEVAMGGTVFLDEIGDMPYQMQSKLLTLIEEKKFRRIGGLQYIKANVRIFAATNRNLQQLVHEGKFRLDLYYRLNVATIELLPLRERKEDIPILSNYFLKHYINKYKTPHKQFTDDVIDAFLRYPWPGNIRELKNLIEKLVILSKSDIIDIHDLPSSLYSKVETSDDSEYHQRITAFNGYKIANDLSLKKIEVDCIKKALMLAKGNQKKAAEILNISRDTLRYRLKKLGIKAKEFKI